MKEIKEREKAKENAPNIPPLIRLQRLVENIPNLDLTDHAPLINILLGLHAHAADDACHPLAAIIADLASSDAEYCHRFIALLDSINNTDSHRKLIALLAPINIPDIRRKIIDFLFGINDSKAHRQIIEFLHTLNDSKACNQYIEFLHTLNSFEACRQIIAILNDLNDINLSLSLISYLKIFAEGVIGGIIDARSKLINILYRFLDHNDRIDFVNIINNLNNKPDVCFKLFIDLVTLGHKLKNSIASRNLISVIKHLDCDTGIKLLNNFNNGHDNLIIQPDVNFVGVLNSLINNPDDILRLITILDNIIKQDLFLDYSPSLDLITCLDNLDKASDRSTLINLLINNLTNCYVCGIDARFVLIDVLRALREQPDACHHLIDTIYWINDTATIVHLIDVLYHLNHPDDILRLIGIIRRYNNSSANLIGKHNTCYRLIDILHNIPNNYSHDRLCLLNTLGDLGDLDDRSYLIETIIDIGDDNHDARHQLIYAFSKLHNLHKDPCLLVNILYKLNREDSISLIEDLAVIVNDEDLQQRIAAAAKANNTSLADIWAFKLRKGIKDVFELFRKK